MLGRWSHRKRILTHPSEVSLLRSIKRTSLSRTMCLHKDKRQGSHARTNCPSGTGMCPAFHCEGLWDQNFCSLSTSVLLMSISFLDREPTWKDVRKPPRLPTTIQNWIHWCKNSGTMCFLMPKIVCTRSCGCHPQPWKVLYCGCAALEQVYTCLSWHWSIIHCPLTVSFP